MSNKNIPQPAKNCQANIFEQAKETSIIQVAYRLGLNLKKRGCNYVGLCPFHQEKNPSFTINPNKNFFKCYSCGAYGDVTDLVAKLRGISSLEAAKELTGHTVSTGNAKLIQGLNHKRDIKRQFEELEQEFFSTLVACFRAVHKAINYLGPEWLSEMAWMVLLAQELEEMLDVFTFGSINEKIEVINSCAKNLQTSTCKKQS